MNALEMKQERARKLGYVDFVDEFTINFASEILSDIKRRFKSNTFEVGVDSTNPDVLNKELESRYELTRPSFRTIGDNLKLNVKLKNNQNSEDLLKLLNQNSRVIHFKEVIPSANDIFINSIEND